LRADRTLRRRQASSGGGFAIGAISGRTIDAWPRASRSPQRPDGSACRARVGTSSSPSPDDGAGAFLQSCLLQRADHRQHQPRETDVAVFAERLPNAAIIAKIESARQPRDDRRRGNDQQD
jgi:hypothetical protein